MKTRLLHLLDQIDQRVSHFYLSHQKQQPSLLIWVFHVLFQDKKAIEHDTVFPFEQLTVAQLETFLSFIQAQGHHFVGPDQLSKGLTDPGFYHMLTFDDGYFNNSWALPVLEKYQVPALFHIATSYIKAPRSFWWDAHYRARSSEGWSLAAILREQNQLKLRDFRQIEPWLIQEFGAEVLDVRSDQDRPFTQAELIAFAKHPLVCLGNHTHDHAILTDCDPNQVHTQIVSAQQYLQEISGKTPVAIAYPNGNFNAQVGEIAQACGLGMGFTGERSKHFLSQTGNRMELGRVTLYGFRDIAGQAATYLADKSLKWKYAHRK